MDFTEECLCCSGKAASECCAKYLYQGAYPQNAEALMRSRYSAYVEGNVAYLEKTWHPDTCPELNSDDLRQTRWLRLDVLKHKPGLKKSIVEFKAYYDDNGQECCMHEVSLFKKVKNRWVYVSAEMT